MQQKLWSAMRMFSAMEAAMSNSVEYMIIDKKP